MWDCTFGCYPFTHQAGEAILCRAREHVPSDPIDSKNIDGCYTILRDSLAPLDFPQDHNVKDEVYREYRKAE